MKRYLGFFSIAFAGLLGTWGASYACSSAEIIKATVPESVFGQQPPAWEWPVSTPEEQGLDSKKLAELEELIRKGDLCPRLHALLIVRHGYLVVEDYFNGWQRDGLHTLQSVSKSFTSALIGIGIARGEFKGVDEKILDFFPDMNGIANMDERKASIRLKDLLTMRSGTDYHEQGANSPHEQLNKLLKGWDKFYLDRPMLKPLGIEKKFWFRNLEGQTAAGGGLALAARDTAKFGLLYLKNGKWADEQIVPEEWVRESFRMHVDLTVKGQPPSGYGYLWWILAPDPRGNGRQYVYAARGRFGQFIFIVPEYDMVVVMNSYARPGIDQDNFMSLFYDQILPAVRR